MYYYFVASGAKKSGKVRIPHGIPWTRSDSDPNLMDGYEQKQPAADVKVIDTLIIAILIIKGALLHLFFYSNF